MTSGAGATSPAVPSGGGDGDSCSFLAFEAVARLWLDCGRVADLEAVDILHNPFHRPLDDIFCLW